MAAGGQQKMHEPDESKDEEKQEGEQEQVEIYVGRLGSDAKKLTITDGTTVGDVADQEGFAKQELRLNRTTTTRTTVLKQGDVLVAVPDAFGDSLRLAA